jgi:hypothetical protein
MNTTMHDLLATAVERRESSIAHGASFADGHGAPLLRAIRVRRVATYAGTGTVAAVAAVSAGLGVHSWAASSSTLLPVGNPSGASSASPSDSPSVAAEVGGSRTVTLVPVPIAASVYQTGETAREYVYYASLGTSDMIPFPGGGIWYPGIADVPSDAFILLLNGDRDGYDIEAPGAVRSSIGAISAASDQGDLIGNRTSASGPIWWDVVGYVSSTTEWGVHYFMLDGKLVSEEEGMSNPAAIEVTAMFDPTTFDPTVSAVVDEG